jgi:hypothetical protein
LASCPAGDYGKLCTLPGFRYAATGVRVAIRQDFPRVKFRHLLSYVFNNVSHVIVVGILLVIVWFAMYPARINGQISQGMEYTNVLNIVGEKPWKQLKQADFCRDYKVERICSVPSDDTIHVWILGVDTLLYVAINSSNMVTKHGLFDT